MAQIYFLKWALFINTNKIIKINTKYLFLVLIFCSIESLASRARLSALQNNSHIADTENIFLYPTKMSEYDSFLSVESGATTATDLSSGAFAAGLVHLNNKGMAVFSEATLGFSLGRKNDVSDSARKYFNKITTETFELSQNSAQILWSYKLNGETFGLGIFTSGKNDKVNLTSESTQVLNFGYRKGFITFSATAPLVNEVVTSTNKKLNFSDALTASVLYEIDTLVLSADVDNFYAEQKNSGNVVNSLEQQSFRLSLSETTHFEINKLFYRVDLQVKNLKYRLTDVKVRENKLPLTLGLESEVNTWLVLRTSIQQAVLIYQTENLPAAENSTLAAFGAGLKFKNIILDGTFSDLIGSAQTGSLSGNQFLGQVALTATF